jgi:hypothetical protein
VESMKYSDYLSFSRLFVFPANQQALVAFTGMLNLTSMDHVN